MTDSISRQQSPAPLSYRKADRDRVLSKLVRDLVQGVAADQRLTTKSLADPTVALLDAWATVADIVDFFQERIAAESYLSTAVEPESVLALATLLGYQPRPGLAATCWLAYTLVPDVPDTAVLLPKHQLVQSVPGTGELPQTFETTSDLVARPSWNKLPVKMTAPMMPAAGENRSPDARLHTPPAGMVVSGVNTQLKPNDAVLLRLSSSRNETTPAQFIVAKVQKAEFDLFAQTTRIDFQESPTDPDNSSRRPSPEGSPSQLKSPTDKDPSGTLAGRLEQLVGSLPGGNRDVPGGTQKTVPRVTEKTVPRDTGKLFNRNTLGPDEPDVTELSDMKINLLAQLHPDASKALYPALSTTAVGQPYLDSVYALRGRAAPFGVDVPRRARYDSQGSPLSPEEWPIGDTQTITIVDDVNLGEVDRAAILEAPVRVATPKKTETAQVDRRSPEKAIEMGGGTISLQPPDDKSDERVLVFTPADADLDKISVHIGSDLLVTVTNATTDDTVTVSLAQALALLPVPSPVVAQSSKGLSLRVQSSLLPGREGFGRVVIEVVSALPLKERTVLDLNAPRDEIVPGSYVVIDNPRAARSRPSLGNAVLAGADDDEPGYPVVAKVVSADPVSVSRYGTTLSVTRLNLDSSWVGAAARLLSDVREITIHVQSELLEAQPVPITESIGSHPPPGVLEEIAISGLVPGIETGRRLLITGARDDLYGAAVDAGEVITVAAVMQVYAPGEPPYTKLSLAAPLRYRYRRDSVTLYGNVVEAHHGATVTESLVAVGDAGNPTVTLSQSPVLADPSGTGLGFESSLTLEIDGRVWTWVPRIDGRTPSRSFMTGTDGQGRTVITLSQPLPHPASRIVATYRTGDGAAGNLRAGQLTQLLTRPLSVADVINPLAASGGSRPDGPDTVRADAPRGLQALGRVVSAQDAADIALTWAGIGKSQATLASRDGRETLIVTVAGTEPTQLVDSSELVRDLGASLVAAGDVTVPIMVEPAPISLIVMTATILPASDFTWDGIERAVRKQLLESFGYDQREIGQDVVMSDLISVIHRVAGVRSCSITGIGVVNAGISPADLIAFDLRPPLSRERISLQVDEKFNRLRPGVAFLSGTVVDTLILQEERP